MLYGRLGGGGPWLVLDGRLGGGGPWLVLYGRLCWGLTNVEELGQRNRCAETMIGEEEPLDTQRHASHAGWTAIYVCFGCAACLSHIAVCLTWMCSTSA